MRIGAVVVAGVLLAAGCGGSSGSGDGGLEAVSLVGETEQGMRMRLDVVGDREISLRIPVDCAVPDEESGASTGAGGSPTSLDRHPLRARVAWDGSFTVDESYVEDGADGSEEHVDVRVEGSVESGGAATATATGTLEVRARWWEGQAEEFSSWCHSGTVRWTADEAARQGDDLVAQPAPSAPMGILRAAGPDLLAVSESGEALRVDHATGDARPLDGSTPAGPGSTQGPGSPATAEVGGPGDLLRWNDGVVVVADGVWMPDPHTGAVTRTELADGEQTATIGAFVNAMVGGHGALWTVSTPIRPAPRTLAAYTLDKRDPVTGAVVASVPVLTGTLAAGPTGLWQTYSTLDGTWHVDRIDPETLAVVATFDVDLGAAPDRVAVTEDRVWFATGRSLMSIDAANGQPRTVDLPSEPNWIAGDRTGIWVTHPRESVVRRIEGDDIVRTVDVPHGWWDVALTEDGAVWLSGRDAILRLDPATTGG